VTEDDVAFRWKDYRHHGKSKVMTLRADEFIGRLPAGRLSSYPPTRSIAAPAVAA
jgi:Putative transposase